MEILIPFPNRILLLPYEAIKCEQLFSSEQEVSDNYRWNVVKMDSFMAAKICHAGIVSLFFYVICCFVLVSHQRLFRQKLAKLKVHFLIYLEDKFTFDFQLSKILLIIHSIMRFAENHFNVKVDFVKMLEYFTFYVLVSIFNNNQLNFDFHHS